MCVKTVSGFRSTWFTRRIHLPVLVLLLIRGGVLAQPEVVESRDTSHVDYLRLAAVSAGGAGVIFAVHEYQKAAWWQGARAPFRFENDWKYALNIDKIGHVYGAYIEARLFRSVFSWIGFGSTSSTFYGSMFGLAFQLYVEVEDGFHRDYGFSPGDAFADIVGSAIPLAQETFPVLQNFEMKFSYYPSSKFLEDLRQGKSRSFFDDYEGQIFWVGMDPHFLMGEDLRDLVPSWLGISVGAGVRDLNGMGGGTRSVYLALDYNFRRISTDSGFLKTLFSALDFLHFPAPGIGLEGTRLKAGIIY